jgi:metal-responsive CopG/Arc/MetJ family transcriptional regulator
MSTDRTSKTTTISLPPKVYSEMDRLAKAKGMTRSELLRDALRRYQSDEQEWRELTAQGRRLALKAGIRTEEDVERLIDEMRKSRDDPSGRHLGGARPHPSTRLGPGRARGLGSR